MSATNFLPSTNISSWLHKNISGIVLLGNLHHKIVKKMCMVEFLRRLEGITTVLTVHFPRNVFGWTKPFSEPKAPFWRFEIFPRKQFDNNGFFDVSVEGQNGFQVRWVILPFSSDTVKLKNLPKNIPSKFFCPDAEAWAAGARKFKLSTNHNVFWTLRRLSCIMQFCFDKFFNGKGQVWTLAGTKSFHLHKGPRLVFWHN